MKWSKFEVKYPNLYENSKKMKLPEFYYSYDSLDFEDVYEPAEDTFLMIDTLNMEISNENIFSNFKNIISCEIGCGSSLTSFQFVNNILEKNYNLLQHFCLDINKKAVEVSKKVLKLISSKLESEVESNSNSMKEPKTDLKLQSEININFTNKFTIEITADFLDNDSFNKYLESNIADTLILIFNPPYVTTPDEELKEALEKRNIISSWAGGKNGSEIINRFVFYLENKLNIFLSEQKSLKSVILYLLLSSENEYSDIIINLTKNDFFSFWECLSVGKYKNERLGIFKFSFVRKI